MYKLIEFIRSIYVLVLFVLIEAIAIGHYARSTHYAQARLLATASRVVGDGESLVSQVGRYFRLARENRELVAYAAQLQQRLAAFEAADRLHPADFAIGIGAADTDPLTGPDSVVLENDRALHGLLADPQYRMLTASVVSNTINKSENFLILNRGRRDGVRREMAVLSAGGAIVGHVIACSERYAVALSVLSRSFRTSGKLAGSNYFGQIYWDGTDPHRVVLGDLTKYAEPQPGDEVETVGSLFFPDGIRIGRVIDSELDETGMTYTVRVELAARMTGLSHVILVENLDLAEIDTLLQQEHVKQYNR